MFRGKTEGQELLGRQRHILKLKGGMGGKVLEFPDHLVGFLGASQHVGHGGLHVLEFAAGLHGIDRDACQRGAYRRDTEGGVPGEGHAFPAEGIVQLALYRFQFLLQIGRIRPDVHQKVSYLCGHGLCPPFPD